MAMHPQSRPTLNWSSTPSIVDFAARQLPADGFLLHPRGYPLDCRRLWSARASAANASIGVCFFSMHFVRVGTWVELAIPLRHEQQRFRGEVVLVRRSGAGHDIGVWLQTESDAQRARLVERICALEFRLKQRASAPLPPTNRVHTMREWFCRLTGHVPALVDSRFV